METIMNYDPNNLPEFITNEDFFKWRSAWRTDYKALSAEIRMLKVTRNRLFRDGVYAGNVQSQLAASRVRARAMMETRTALSARWLARKNALDKAA